MAGEDRLGTREESGVRGAIVMTPGRWDCLAASVAILFQRSNLDLPSGWTTERAVCRGMKWVTPSSESFSIIQSARSPLGIAEARVRDMDEAGGRTVPTLSMTWFFEQLSTVASALFPASSKTSRTSPLPIRRT